MPNEVQPVLYDAITARLFEIARQLRQPEGYTYDPVVLREDLEDIINGRFKNIKAGILETEPWEKRKHLGWMQTISLPELSYPAAFDDLRKKAAEYIWWERNFDRQPSEWGKIKILKMDKTFVECLIPKASERIPAVELKIHSVLEDQLFDAEAVVELGEQCEARVGHLLHLLEQQGHGEDGPLSIESTNFAYVRDKDYVLRVVCLLWRKPEADDLLDGWEIHCWDFQNPDGLVSDNLLISACEPSQT